MKRNLLAIIGLFIFAGFFAACDSGDKAADLQTHEDSIAYVIGANIGQNLLQNIERDSLDFAPAALIAGFRDALNHTDSLVFTEEEKQAIMMAFQQEMQQKQAQKMADAAGPVKAAGQQWLAENKTKEGIVQTASGLQYKVVKMGNGKQPTANDQVTVNYEGKLIDGKIFDSSYERKQPATFQLGNVIRGWQEGLMLMKEGSTFELFIPSDLGYGDQGYPPDIPGGSVLIFKVELIKVEAAPQGNAQVPVQ